MRTAPSGKLNVKTGPPSTQFPPGSSLYFSLCVDYVTRRNFTAQSFYLRAKDSRRVSCPAIVLWQSIRPKWAYLKQNLLFFSMVAV